MIVRSRIHRPVLPLLLIAWSLSIYFVIDHEEAHIHRLQTTLAVVLAAQDHNP